MASEWANLTANQMFEGWGLTVKPMRDLIAEALDTARAQGRREGLEEAAYVALSVAARINGTCERMAKGADLVAADIRARIEQPAAREGLEEQGAPVGWRYKVLMDRHTTGDPQPGEICMLDINRVPCYGVPGRWKYSNGPDKPAVDWMCTAEPLYARRPTV